MMKRSVVISILSIFVIFLCQMISIVPLLAGVLNFVGNFLGNSSLAVQVSTPLVCPAGSTGRVDTVDSGNTSNINPNNFRAAARYANQFNCVDQAGNVVANKSLEQQQLWGTIVTWATWILLTGCALLVALPLGWLIGRRVARSASPGQAEHTPRGKSHAHKG